LRGEEEQQQPTRDAIPIITASAPRLRLGGRRSDRRNRGGWPPHAGPHRPRHATGAGPHRPRRSSPLLDRLLDHRSPSRLVGGDLRVLRSSAGASSLPPQRAWQLLLFRRGEPRRLAPRLCFFSSRRLLGGERFSAPSSSPRGRAASRRRSPLPPPRRDSASTSASTSFGARRRSIERRRAWRASHRRRALEHDPSSRRRCSSARRHLDRPRSRWRP